jgi:thiol-disulfide isomerase/thioredoxin
MVRLRHIIAGAVAAIISAQAQAGWIPFAEMPAPAARLLFTSGEHRSLQDFKGKVVILNIWATWCGPCRDELPTLEALEEELMTRGLVVIPMTIEKMPPAELKDFLTESGVNLPHAAIDPSSAIRRTLAEGTGIPVTYLIDRKGVVRYKYSGSSDWTRPQRKDRVLELLAEGQGR